MSIQHFSTHRRTLLLAATVTPFAGIYTQVNASTQNADAVQKQLAALESAFNGQLGIAALNTDNNTGNNIQIHYRADTRFPFCSTFKVLLVSALLKRRAIERNLLQQHIRYTKKDLVNYSPITEKHAGIGMTVSELCAAALQYSDNTAANLLIHILGTPATVTEFARSIGDKKFQLDRYETELNTAIPGDVRDTTTPAAMATSLPRLILGDALGATERAQLIKWMQGNTTGNARIRAGVPKDWLVADKTGTGDYGTSNDVAVIWPPDKPPIVLVIYFTQPEKEAAMSHAVIAKATQIVMGSLVK